MSTAFPDFTLSTALDETALESLRELGGDELVAELATLFVEDAPPRMAGLRDKLAIGAAEEIAKVAHALKSSAANMGAMGFSEICRDLEQAARQGDLASAEKLIDQAFESWKVVRAALERLRN